MQLWIGITISGTMLILIFFVSMAEVSARTVHVCVQYRASTACESRVYPKCTVKAGVVVLMLAFFCCFHCCDLTILMERIYCLSSKMPQLNIKNILFVFS